MKRPGRIWLLFWGWAHILAGAVGASAGGSFLVVHAVEPLDGAIVRAAALLVIGSFLYGLGGVAIVDGYRGTSVVCQYLAIAVGALMSAINFVAVYAPSDESVGSEMSFGLAPLTWTALIGWEAVPMTQRLRLSR